MHKGSIGQDSATLGPIEGQINTLLALLPRGRFFVLFPRELEDAYAKYSLTQTLTSDLRIVYAGLMIFLLFGWADLHFGGENGIYLLTIRACITVALAAVGEALDHSLRALKSQPCLGEIGPKIDRIGAVEYLK